MREQSHILYDIADASPQANHVALAVGAPFTRTSPPLGFRRRLISLSVGGFCRSRCVPVKPKSRLSAPANSGFAVAFAVRKHVEHVAESITGPLVEIVRIFRSNDFQIKRLSDQTISDQLGNSSSSIQLHQNILPSIRKSVRRNAEKCLGRSEVTFARSIQELIDDEAPCRYDLLGVLCANLVWV